MIEVHIEDYWHAADGDNWSPAVARAQSAVANLEPLTIRLGQRQYRCLSQIEIFHQVLVLGPEATTRMSVTTVDIPGSQVCTLYFPQSAGILFQYPKQYIPDPTAQSEAPALRNVQLRGPGSTYAASGARDMHGITVRRTAEVCHFCVRGFPGNGVHVVADTKLTPPSNANFSLFEHGFIVENGGCGVFNTGGDASHCRFDRISCDNNGLWSRVWSAVPIGVTAVAGIVTVTFASLPVGATVGQMVYPFGARIGSAGQDWQLGIIINIVGAVLTIDTTRNPGFVADGTFTTVGTFYGLRTYTTTSANALGRIVTYQAANDVRPGDIVLAHGFTASSGSGDYHFGVVAATGSSSAAIAVETVYDTVAAIPDGAFADGVGFVAIRPAQFFSRPLIGSLFMNCEAGANQNGGEGYVGINANLFLYCYTEGASPARSSKIRPPGFAIGGAMYPDPSSCHISGTLNMLSIAPGVQGASLFSPDIIGRIGSALKNAVMEWQNGVASPPFRVQMGLGEPNTWELAYANAPNNTAFRVGDGTNHRLGTAEFWTPRGFWYGGISKESDTGTSFRRGFETGTLDGQRCLYEIVVEDNVAGTSTSSGTAALLVGLNWPTYVTDGTHDLRIVTRNVGGTPIVNGVRRGRVFSPNTLQLRTLSNGSALTLSGTYMANTGVMGVYRAIIDGVVPPATSTFYAVGDVVRNQHPMNGILYWLCIESGTPGRWAPVRAAGASGLVAASVFPFTASVFDEVIFVDGGAVAKMVHLPSLASHHTRKIIVKDRLGTAGAGNTITVLANGNDTIDGVASQVINTAYGVLRLQGGNGASPTNWSVV